LRAIATRIVVLAVVVIIVVAGVGYYLIAGTGPASNQHKLAMIISGPVSDQDYEALGYQTLQALKTKFSITTAYSENVNPADATSAVSQYVTQGYDVIWAHGAEFASAIGAGTDQNGVAAQFPNTTFIIETDVPPAQIRPNVWVIDRNYIPGQYADGAAAALATKTGVIAYIGGLELPFSDAEANAIIKAAHDTNSSVKVLRYWTDDFFDAVKASSAANALVAQHADVIINSLNLGYFGIVQAVNNSNVLLIAKYTDKAASAPNNQMTSFMFNFNGPLTSVYTSITNGVRSGLLKLTYGTDNFTLLPLKNVSTATSDAVSAIVDKLKNGQITVAFNTTAPGAGP
jgi:basic membrane protein A